MKFLAIVTSVRHVFPSQTRFCLSESLKTRLSCDFVCCKDLAALSPEYTTSGDYRSCVAGGSAQGASSRLTVADTAIDGSVGDTRDNDSICPHSIIAHLLRFSLQKRRRCHYFHRILKVFRTPPSLLPLETAEV